MIHEQAVNFEISRDMDFLCHSLHVFYWPQIKIMSSFHGSTLHHTKNHTSKTASEMHLWEKGESKCQIFSPKALLKVVNDVVPTDLTATEWRPCYSRLTLCSRLTPMTMTSFSIAFLVILALNSCGLLNVVVGPGSQHPLTVSCAIRQHTQSTAVLQLTCQQCHQSRQSALSLWWHTAVWLHAASLFWNASKMCLAGSQKTCGFSTLAAKTKESCSKQKPRERRSQLQQHWSGGTVVPFQDKVELLGLTFDFAMMMDRTETSLRSSAPATVPLSRTAYQLTFDAAKTIGHSIVSLQNSLLHGMSSNIVDTLHNSFARSVRPSFD